MIAVKTLRNWDKNRMKYGGYDWKIISCIQTHASRINYLVPCMPFAAKGSDKVPLLMERRLTQGGLHWANITFQNEIYITETVMSTNRRQ